LKEDIQREFLDPKVLSKLSSLEINPRGLVEGSFTGKHKSPHKGSSVEFAQYRKYVPGDDIRSVDWKIYAKSDRFYVKEFEAGEDTCLREIKEETGLDARIVKNGGIIEAVDFDNQKRWIVAVYLCEVNSTEVKLCNENSDYKWARLEELKDYDFVPGLKKDLKSLGLE